MAGKSFLVTGGNKCLSTALATITSRLNRVKGPVQERECCLGHPETGTSCTSHCSQGVNWDGVCITIKWWGGVAETDKTIIGNGP